MTIFRTKMADVRYFDLWPVQSRVLYCRFFTLISQKKFSAAFLGTIGIILHHIHTIMAPKTNFLKVLFYQYHWRNVDLILITGVKPYQCPIKQRNTLIWRSSIKNDKLENCAILRNSWLFWEKESCEAIFLVTQLLIIDYLEKGTVMWPFRCC